MPGTADLSGELAATLMELLPSGVLLVGDDGVVRFANQRASELLGTAPVGRRAEEIFVPLTVLARVSTGADPRNVERRVTAQGGERELGYSVVRVPDHGLAGWLVVFQDITEIARLRRENDRLVQLAAVNDVLPSILHELKNPLAAVRTTVEVMIEERFGTPVAEELHPVLNEIRRMGLTLDGVGRLDNELRSTRPAAIDEACREAFSVLVGTGKAKGVTMTADVATLPLLRFDTAGVRAIVFNLVMNAIHACRPGDQIGLSVRLEGGTLLLQVKDTGAGMTPEVKRRCTELFFTTKQKGTGLGLALVQSLVSSAGGTLSIDSVSNLGTTVTLRLAVDPQA